MTYSFTVSLIETVNENYKFTYSPLMQLIFSQTI
uniref:Uncharacterized protein n=1 Tax=Anguilla anguilla TaxID=7936 RepID=A0A0E9TK71_ANGAN